MRLGNVYTYMMLMVLSFIPELIWSGLSAFGISSDPIFWSYFITQQILIIITIMLISGVYRFALEESFVPSSLRKLRSSMIIVMVFFTANTAFYMTGYFGELWSSRIWNLTAGIGRFLIYLIALIMVIISGIVVISRERKE